MRQLCGVLLLAGGLLTGVPAAAQTAADCARMTDEKARLACFDRVFPRAGSAPSDQSEPGAERDADAVAPEPAASAAEPPAPAPEAEAEATAASSAAPGLPAPDSGPPPVPPERASEPPPAPAATVESSPPRGGPTDAPASERTTAAESPPSKGGLFNDPKVNLTTTIVALRRADKQKMIFLLDNEQVWIQSSPRPLPFREGDTVTIRNATFGGYIMRSTKGTGTRVQRLR